MKNLWVQTENPFATWVADLTDIAADPAALVEVGRAVLTAGAKHHVYEVAEAPLIDYRRDRDGALGDVMTRLLERDRIVDLFGFTGAAMLPSHAESSAVETTVCYYDRADVRVEQAVTDLGALLASLEPVPGSISNSFMTHYPAVRITGRRYADVRVGVPVDDRPNRRPVAIYIAIHSDIWFPWVFGFAHPERDLERMFDNRELAMCHTPRLNGFLADVAAATRGAGGLFELWPDFTAMPAREWVDDASVHLDWTPADGIMPPEALDAKWV